MPTQFMVGGSTYTVDAILTDLQVQVSYPGASPVVAQKGPFLPQARSSALAKVSAWRVERESAGFAYAGKLWQSDALSAQRIMGAAILAMSSPAYSQAWVASDNSVVVFDQAGIQGLFAALGAHVAATFATGQTAKAAINAATTVKQIEAVLATPRRPSNRSRRCWRR